MRSQLSAVSDQQSVGNDDKGVAVTLPGLNADR
jgi:hypothetical protein